MKKFFKWIAAFFLGFVVLLGANSIDTSVSPEEDLMFSSLYPGKKEIAHGLIFNKQIDLIREIQFDILQRVPFGAPISEYSSREPIEFLKRDSGLCYDRSRTFDKLFKWAGFETRHIYILYNSQSISNSTLSFVITLFTPRSDSHAVTEVKTSKGWLVVDSNSNWVSVSRSGAPISADHITLNENGFDHIPGYFLRPYLAIRGLYSRRGHLYAPYLPVPQLNWTDFFRWVLNE